VIVLSIANRILIGFAVLTALFIVAGLYHLNQLAAVQNRTEIIVTRDIGMMRQVIAMRASQQLIRTLSDGAVKDFYARSLNRPPASQVDFAEQFRSEARQAADAIANARNTADRFQATAVARERAEEWGRILTILTAAANDFERIRQQTEELFRAIAANDLGTVGSIDSQLATAHASFRSHMQAVEQALNTVVVTGQTAVRDVYERGQVSVIASLLLAVLLSILITILVRRSIVGPLGAFMQFVDRVGRGDLSGEAAASSRDELGQLGATLNAMVEGLRQMAKQTREATENLNAASAEIRASTQEQAAGVEEQLAAVQETAATVDEITHSGAQIGKRAQEVIASAQTTAQTSTEGLRAVGETARAMDLIREQAEAVASNIVSLSEKTQAIGEITATVNDISERSHLLALNAAIEAAAAGEAGRSFTVVASELKLLADQAKEATAQVRAILGDIQRGINASVMLTEEAVKRVTAGKERTDTTYKTITEITTRIQESVQTFQQIVASTNQQQLGIEQVMGALQNIRQASQQTAAGTRQLDTAASNLAGLSQQLLTLAERYRV
jgi:methyl-accepting chemotaxis protein